MAKVSLMMDQFVHRADLARLALSARLNLVEGGGRGGIYVAVDSVRVAVMLVVGVVRDLLDGGGHGGQTTSRRWVSNPSVQTAN